MTEVVIFSLERAEAEFLEEALTLLAEEKLDAARTASDPYEEKAAKALDSIADRIHSALYKAERESTTTGRPRGSPSRPLRPERSDSK